MNDHWSNVHSFKGSYLARTKCFLSNHLVKTITKFAKYSKFLEIVCYIYEKILENEMEKKIET